MDLGFLNNVAEGVMQFGRNFVLLLFLLNVVGLVLAVVITLPAKSVLHSSLLFVGVQIVSSFALVAFFLVPLMGLFFIRFLNKKQFHKHDWMKIPLWTAFAVDILVIGGAVGVQVAGLI